MAQIDTDTALRQKLKYYNHAKSIIQNRMIFLFHVSLYLTVNVMLIGLNAIHYNGVWWFWIPLLSWGIGLSGHYCYAYIFMDIFSKNPMQHERFERKAQFFIHLIVYILGNATFLFLDYLYPPVNYWVVYPLLGWGIGLFYHFFFVFIFRGWKIKQWKQAKIVALMKKYYDIDPFEEMPRDTSSSGK